MAKTRIPLNSCCVHQCYIETSWKYIIQHTGGKEKQKTTLHLFCTQILHVQWNVMEQAILLWKDGKKRKARRLLRICCVLDNELSCYRNSLLVFQQTTLQWKDCRKEKQDDDSTSAVYTRITNEMSWNSLVILLSCHLSIVGWSCCVFSPCLFLPSFTCPPLWVINFTEIFLLVASWKQPISHRTLNLSETK